MPVSLNDNEVVSHLRHWAQRELPPFRQTLVAQLAHAVLQRVAAETPVRTGRLRRAWREAQESLNAGGSSSVSGSRGNDAAESLTSFHESATDSRVVIENHVPYAASVEFGTRRQAPVYMVTRGMQNVAAHLQQYPDHYWRR